MGNGGENREGGKVVLTYDKAAQELGVEFVTQEEFEVAVVALNAKLNGTSIEHERKVLANRKFVGLSKSPSAMGALKLERLSKVLVAGKEREVFCLGNKTPSGFELVID